ncbi:MAG: branched-chain amino acid ABC transporter permease [Nakamurella sp.]
MQQILNGIFTGSIYALFAVGYTLVFGVLDRLNLAHSAVFAAGAYIAITLVDQAGFSIWLAIPAVLVAGAILGIIVERVAFRPLANRRDAHFAGLISSIALAAMFIALLQAVYGPDRQQFPFDALPAATVSIGSAQATVIQLVIVAVSVALMVALALMVGRSNLGRGMRAVAENPHAARVLGLNVERITWMTFAISSALGAVAGVLFALNVNVAQLDLGSSIELKGLAVIILGGMGSLPGAVIGGYALGLAEVAAITFVGSSWKDVIAFGLLFLILIVRPKGLFGGRQVREI